MAFRPEVSAARIRKQRTWYTAMKPITPDSVQLPPTDPRYVDGAPKLSAADRRKIFEGNARRVYGRLGAALRAVA